MTKNKKTIPKPIKRSLITISEFRSRHYRNSAFNTDMYYIGVANRLYPFLTKMIGKDDKRFEDSVVRELTLNLVCYLEDLVSQAGVWEAFVSLHLKKYGREMPFYDTDDEFYSREFPCIQAVRFIVWMTLNANSSDTFLNPDNPFMHMMSLGVLPMLIEAYDNAPDTPSRPALVPEEKMGVPLFYQIRNMCHWLCTGCYLTRIHDTELISELLNPLSEKFFNGDSGKDDYLKEAYISFNAKIGPLALCAQEWLAEIVNIYHEEEEKEFIPLLRELTSLPYSIYSYKELRKEGAVLLALDGSEMELSAFTMPDCRMPAELSENESALMSLVYFGGKWMMNGIAAQGLPRDLYANARRTLIKNIDNRKQTFKSLLGFMKKRIGVCAGYEAYLDMFPGIDRKRFMNVPDDIRTADNLLYFLNDDSVVTLLPEWGRCVKIRGNKFYDKKESEDDGICLILDHDLTTPEMRECLIDKNLVPDAALNSMDSVKAGKKLFQDNIRFLNDYTDRDTILVFSNDMFLGDDQKNNLNETDA